MVKRFNTDIAEGSCLPFSTSLRPMEKPSGSKVAGGRGGKGRATAGKSGSTSFPAVGNPVHSQREDSLERAPECVLAISRSVRINIHPQELINTTFAF